MSQKDEAILSQRVNELVYAINASSIVATTDLNGAITDVNEAFCKISQYSREELIGKNHSIVNSGFHDKSFFQEMWRTISRGKTWKGEIQNRAKDGSYYWVETTIVPFINEEGRPYQYMALRTDITYKKVAEKQISEERAKTIYSEKMASLGEMAAGVAHELGNPLGALRGRAEMMMRRAPAEMDDGFQKILQLCDRMTKIIRGLSSYARDASSDPFTRVNLNKLVEDILSFSNEKFHKVGVEVIIEPISESLFVNAREAELGQVIVNLVSNSCDAVKDLDDKKIWILAREKNDRVEICVKDSGHGIPKEVEDKIFRSFYTTKPPGKGTGLGLSISKKIIEKHEGQLSYTLEEGNTCFKISLPYEKN